MSEDEVCIMDFRLVFGLFKLNCKDIFISIINIVSFNKLKNKLKISKDI